MTGTRYEDKDGTVLVPVKKPKVKKPEHYQVILLNDNYTPREFVVFVLEKVFQLSETKAQIVMQEAHLSGKSSCGTYTRDVAETKIHEAKALAKEHAFPLHFELARQL